MSTCLAYQTAHNKEGTRMQLQQLKNYRQSLNENNNYNNNNTRWDKLTKIQKAFSEWITNAKQ
jgi:hypothetical protein